MNEWKEFLIEDLAEFCNAKRVPLSSMQRQQLQGSYPYYGASGIVDYVNDYIFEGSHVLISEDGENLKSRNTPIAFEASGKFWVNNHAHILKAKEPHLTKILIHYFAQLDLTPYLTGAVQPKLNKATLSKIPLYLPSSTAEQKAIASVLSSLDDKIDLLHRQNKTLEAMAETLFRQWFIEEAKEDWEEVIISNLFEVRDGTHDSPKQSSIGYPLVTSKHIGNGILDISSCYLISQSDYDKVNSRSKVDKHDILLSMIGTLGRTYLEFEDQISYAIKNIGLFKTSQSPMWRYYIYLWLISPLGKQFVDEHKSGSTQEYLSLGSLRGIRLSRPPNELLQEFNSCVDSLFMKAHQNRKQIQTLEKLRDTLLPKLMSGEVRVQYQTEEVA